VIDNRGTQRNVSCLFLSVHQTMRKETLCDGNTVALYTGTQSDMNPMRPGVKLNLVPWNYSPFAIVSLD
jgi:hypothetical protein